MLYALLGRGAAADTAGIHLQAAEQINSPGLGVGCAGITHGISPTATTSTACPAAATSQFQRYRWDGGGRAEGSIGRHCYAAGRRMPTLSISALQDREAIHKLGTRPSETCHSHRPPPCSWCREGFASSWSPVSTSEYPAVADRAVPGSPGEEGRCLLHIFKPSKSFLGSVSSSSIAPA